MTLDEFEALSLRIGLADGALNVRALMVGLGGASAYETDDFWRPVPYLDDLYMRGRRGRRRFPVGPGVFQVGEGPVRSLGADAVLVLEVAEAIAPSRRCDLHYAELLVSGRTAARFRSGRWYYADRSAEGKLLTLAPASFLGPADFDQPGALSRPSALAS